MTFPDFDDLILTRLQLCYEAITGVTRSFRLPPIQPLIDGDLPCVYTIPGGMAAPVPAGQAGSVVIRGVYVARLLVTPLAKASMDAGDLGAYAVTQVMPFRQRFRAYFLSNPRLTTSTLGALAWITEDLLYQDSGPVARPGPGGNDYAALDVTLTIGMRALLDRIS